MWFNILTNNHGPIDIAVALTPLIDFIQKTLRLCGHQVTVSYDQLFNDAVNIYLESFHDTHFVDRLLAAKAEHRLKIGVVATELMVDGRIPYAEHGILYGGGNKAELLSLRTRNFDRMVAGADFTWCLLERTAQAYRGHGPQVHFLPVGHTHPDQPGFNSAPRNIDVFFFGTATPHRLKVLGDLESQGVGVTAVGRGFPIGWLPAVHMNSLIDRAKIGLNLTLHAFDSKAGGVDPRFVSCMRVVEMLERETCVVSEVIPYDNPYTEFMQLAESENLGRVCRAFLASGAWAKFAHSAASDFRTRMNVTEICKPVIDLTVGSLGN